MNNTKAPRTARNGKAMWASLDNMSLARLAWAKHVAINRLTTAATNSTITRRALTLYQAHLEALCSPLAAPNELDAERRALMAANRGDTRSVSAEAIAALPTSDGHSTPTLTQMLAAPAGQSPNDWMKRDLERWAAEAKAEANNG